MKNTYLNCPCPKPVFIQTKNGFPIFSNRNNLGSSLSSVMICRHKILFPTPGSIRTKIIERDVNVLGGVEGSIGGIRRNLRNTF